MSDKKPPDQNDQHKAGELKPHPRAGAEPLNGKAQKVADNEPRILTVRQILEAAARRAKKEGQQEVCTTGHYQLDDVTGGIRPGKGWVFAAETNWGKSSWLVAVTDENLRRGKRVLIVTSEDDEETYGARLLARRSRVAAKKLRGGNGALDSWHDDAIKRVIDASENLPVFLDAREKPVEWVVPQVEKLIDSEGIDLVAYDYLQEFSTKHREENHRLTVKHIAGRLRKCVKLKKKASIIFSQITEQTNVKNEYPNRNMIRDCRDVANAAEVILLGYTPGKAVTDGEGPEATILVPAGGRAVFVDKVKDGPKGFAVGMDWDDDTASFNRVDRPRRPQQQQAGGYSGDEGRYGA